MAEKDLEAGDIERKVHDLAAAMKEIKTANADRDDVVVEMKQAKVSRLELLADDLQPVFADVPKNDERFEFAFVKGETPRLWIDMTSFVRMGRDGRHYEFIKDTRLGRTVLATSDKRETVGRHITRYIAERMLERERLLEDEWVSMRDKSMAGTQTPLDEKQEDVAAETTAATRGSDRQEKVAKSIGLLSAFIWFLFGLLIGLAVFATAMVFDQFQPLMTWISGIAQ
ncbi:MAG: hypothetical protein AAFN43_02565 [Pseudomonadota bacterium]